MHSLAHFIDSYAFFNLFLIIFKGRKSYECSIQKKKKEKQKRIRKKHNHKRYRLIVTDPKQCISKIEDEYCIT